MSSSHIMNAPASPPHEERKAEERNSLQLSPTVSWKQGAGRGLPAPKAIESDFWRLVLSHHFCVYYAKYLKQL